MKGYLLSKIMPLAKNLNLGVFFWARDGNNLIVTCPSLGNGSCQLENLNVDFSVYSMEINK